MGIIENHTLEIVHFVQNCPFHARCGSKWTMETEQQQECILSLVFQLPIENQIRLALTILQEIESTEISIEEFPELEIELFCRIKECETGYQSLIC